MHIHIIDSNLKILELTLDTNLCFNLAMRKSSRLITHFYEERLSAVGLKSGQFSILRAVHLLKETSNKQLQSVLVLDQTTLSRNLKPLIRDGYLKLCEDDEDRRIKNISLTPSGQTLYKKTLPIWQKAQKDLLEKIGNSEAEKILSLSNSFIKALSEV